jgi:uncharacterized protein DUF6928
MGAKTAILAYSHGSVADRLRTAGPSDPIAAQALVERVLPGYTVEPYEPSDLWDAVYPPDDITYAISVPGLDLVCDRRLALDRPARLPEHLVALAGGRRIVVHAMHSGSDWLSFAEWIDGDVRRSLSLAPDNGVIEDIGQRYAFEEPYWAGEHPVDAIFGEDGDTPYPLPFHPLELGEVALRHLFGFVIEDIPDPDDIPAEDITVHGFQVIDPTGREAAERDARLAEFDSQHRLRTFRFNPDGTMSEVVDGW